MTIADNYIVLGDAVALVLALAASYLVGTFPTAVVVGRRAGFDPTAAGSGNPGASNAYRLGGRRAGVLVLAGDVLKGLGPTVVGSVAGGRDWAVACGAAAVGGHMFPLTRRFRGGKGVATAAGVALWLWPLPSLVAALVWVAVAAATRKASLASFSAAVVLPIAVATAGYVAQEVWTLVVLAALIVLRHRQNLARLARGEERSLPSARDRT